jgi:hypothetical protein
MLIGHLWVDIMLGHIPWVHWDRKKMIDGKLFHLAEITDNAGTHGIWLDKDKLPFMEIRNPRKAYQRAT